MEEFFELDGKNYIITHEIQENGFIYYFLSGEKDIYDIMIRKAKADDQETIYPLDDEKEFKYAINLLRKKMTEQPNVNLSI